MADGGDNSGYGNLVMTMVVMLVAGWQCRMEAVFSGRNDAGSC